MKNILVVGDQTMSLAEIACCVEDELKMSSTALVVRIFRDKNKICLLRAIIPFLSKGNQFAIDDVLSQNKLSLYY